MSKCGVLATAILAAVTAALSIAGAIYILIRWEGNRYCWVWTFHDLDDDDYYYSYYNGSSRRPDYCNEALYASLAFLDVVLFATTSAFLFVFYCRMDKLNMERAAERKYETEKKENDKEATNTVPTAVPVVDATEPGEASYAIDL